MNPAIGKMLDKYGCKSIDDYIQALREIFQEIILLGLWRSKFFEKAAFYGGSALRILHGLDRYSEDLDFSLLKTDPDFDISRYSDSLITEIKSFGFEVLFIRKKKKIGNDIDSAFIKTLVLQDLIEIQAGPEIINSVTKEKSIKIKIEIDITPPSKFHTESQFLINPAPFSVRSYSLPDLFAGKINAILSRQWKNRVKGRDWYDLMWFIANHPQLNLKHLWERAKKSGYLEHERLTPEKLFDLLNKRIDHVDFSLARKDVERFLKDTGSLTLWSPDFFRQIIKKIDVV